MISTPPSSQGPILSIDNAILQKSFFPPPPKLSRGSLDKGFKLASYIVEGTVHGGSQKHFYMEVVMKFQQFVMMKRKKYIMLELHLDAVTSVD